MTKNEKAPPFSKFAESNIHAHLIVGEAEWQLKNLDSFSKSLASELISIVEELRNQISKMDTLIHQNDIQKKYNELLYAVHSKHPGESRHETALRCIRNSEKNNTHENQSYQE